MTQQPSGAFVAINANNKAELEQVLSVTIDELIERHAQVQQAIMQERRHNEFMRYLRTGKFD